jgi:hypothetical protein
MCHLEFSWATVEQIEQKFLFKFAFRKSVGDDVTKNRSKVLCI